MGLLDFAATYFSAPQVLVVLVSIYAAVAGLFFVFRFERDRPGFRSKLLLAVFALASSSWVFVGSSLAFCRAFERLYYYHQAMAITMVLGTSLLATLVVCLPVSYLMARRLPALFLRRLERDLESPSAQSSAIMSAMVRSLRLEAVELHVSPRTAPFAYSLGGGSSVIVISRGLENSLDKDEMETVLAHEGAHLRNRDTQLNAIMTVYRRVLFFDPLIRLLEGVIHREREFVCDEVSARETRKPLALASALLKIHTAAGAKSPGVFLAGNIDLYGTRTLKERIDRLMRIADEFEMELGPPPDASSR